MSVYVDISTVTLGVMSVRKVGLVVGSVGLCTAGWAMLMVEVKSNGSHCCYLDNTESYFDLNGLRYENIGWCKWREFVFSQGKLDRLRFCLVKCGWGYDGIISPYFIHGLQKTGWRKSGFEPQYPLNTRISHGTSKKSCFHFIDSLKSWEAV